jgi:glycerophosphoryl diester phosphodiesterase
VSCSVYAHRLGGRYGPESSKAALERSLSGPVDGVEADVVLTADGEVVACHDPLLEISTADLEGWAHEHDATALLLARLLDERGDPSDQRPLSLRQLLEIVPPHLTLQLDVKAYAHPDLARRTAECCCEIVLEQGRREQCEIISFFSTACEAAAERGFRTRLVIWADYAPRTLCEWVLERGIGGVSVEGFILGRTLRESLREADLTLCVGAVNTCDQLRRILPFAPDVVVSDCPHELRLSLAELQDAGGVGLETDAARLSAGPE